MRTLKIKAYFLADGDDRLLCESASYDPEEKRRVIGSFRPGIDGNYYKQVLVSFVGEGELQFTMGLASWWEWCKSSIEIGTTLIDEEFTFDPDEIRVVSAEIDMGLAL